LIFVVLLQQGKGAEMGAVFGGSSATIFGSSGAGNLLTRLTTGMAIVFMITSLSLGYFAGHRPSSTIFDTRSPAAQPAPAAPAAPNAASNPGTTAAPQPAAPAAPQDSKAAQQPTKP
jgi:preprotein translocase subunit SecG